MKNLRYISAQPATEYYMWQVEVMINNFIKNGINGNDIDIVCGIKNGIVPDDWRKLANHYNYVRFFFYEDDKVDPHYPSTLRPNILKKHFLKYPELSNEAIFYHDCDIVFTQSVDWSHLLNDDIWYCSDTTSYVGANYIKSKKYGIYERMCEIVGIDEEIPQQHEAHSGGAQYIMKNIDHTFWEKVEHDCTTLYQFFLDHLKAFPESPKYHPIQKWTADMWAVLWNAWYFGHETKVVKEMEFIWPMWKITDWENIKIFHNAGVVNNSAESERLFYKGKYVSGKLPYDIQLDDYNETMSTYNYVKEILETAKLSCLV